jgi:ubiquitin C-terminal hydrolase
VRHCKVINDYMLSLELDTLSKQFKKSGKAYEQELQERVVIEMSILFRLMESRMYTELEPIDLVKKLKLLHPDIKGDTQQDAQEALTYLLDALHEALYCSSVPPPPLEV